MSVPALPHEADKNQARASDPSASAWVSANAGTGKTAVLVKRCLRLLLADFRPESILCLTYTKTAAAEMQNRLLAVLGQWATSDDIKLEAELSELLERAPTRDEMRTARRLFASALEAKGGLKIHTIHGFCERLLQRFPLEAEVTPRFTVLDDQSQQVMRRAAFDAAVSLAAKDRDGPLGRALARALPLSEEGALRQAVEIVMNKRDELSRMVVYHASHPDWTEAEARALKRLFGVENASEENLLTQLAGVLGNAEIDAAIAAIANADDAGKSDRDAAARLQKARASEGEARVAALSTVFLTTEKKPRDRVITMGFAKEAPQIGHMLGHAGEKFARLTDNLAHLRLAEASAAVLTLADAARTEYEKQKSAEAVLDYDDLIVKAQRLLSSVNAAAWVLYKIDGGVDHILVDEAQDTNPAQWNIIEALAAEFFAGSGRSDKLRTLFAVGDEKQSIYSFQGANPARFGEIGRAFKQRASAIGLDWQEVPLTLSFRSTEPILEAVDLVFTAGSVAADGLIWQEDGVIVHQAHRKGQPGLVEIWDVQKQKDAQPTAAFRPWEEEEAGIKAVDELCQRIAATIKGWLDNGEMLHAHGREIKAGDILILVRRRDPFTAPMIRELKRLKVPVAGADRMLLTEQLAVQDLLALADFLLMPEDDLTLAVVLKSPLFGINDGDLFRLAYKRSGSLWEALKSKAGTDVRFGEAASRLSAWLASADFVPPYEFFSELLGADGQALRRAMLTRLGPEAAEAIDEFLDAALTYDREAAPSLQGFVNWLRAGDVEIKRDMEQARDEVRIMTVHGAKGLQAPIVFLPDTCMKQQAQGQQLYPLDRPGEPPAVVGHLLWPPRGHRGIAGVAPAKGAVETAEMREHHRLLYVAMTRAADRLYVCGWEGVRSRPKDCWYNLIFNGLKERLTEFREPDGKIVWRIELEPTAQAKPSESEKDQSIPSLPAWALGVAPRERSRPKLAPSRLSLGLDEDVAAMPDQPPLGPLALGENHRFARGRLVHALLQHLPEVEPSRQEIAARAFVTARGSDLSPDLQAEIVGETLAIVRNATFAPLFQPGSLAEVSVAARIGGYDLEGQIDRLAQLGNAVLILDYKTNRPPPLTLEEVAPAYIAQLAGYRKALKGLLKDRTLRAALLWTDGPRLMEIPSTSLDRAEEALLRRAADLDGIQAAT